MGWQSERDDRDDDFGDEGLDDISDEAEDSEATIACPHCRRPIYEDAERCPYCQRYLSDEDAPSSRKPLWIVLTVIVCLLMVLYWEFPTLFLKLLGF